jgi:hypothetical protein
LIERTDFIRPNGYIMLYYTENLKFQEIYEARFEKYTQKGFTIHKHPKHDLIIKHMQLLADKLKSEDNYNCHDHSSSNLLSFIKDGSLNLEEFD